MNSQSKSFVREPRFIFDVTLIFSIWLLGCGSNFESGEEIQQNRIRSSSLSSLIWLSTQKSGNCQVTKTQTLGNTTKTIETCNRRTRGTCNVDPLLLTSSELNLILYDANNLLKAQESCREGFLASGILVLTPTTEEAIDSLKKNNSFTSIASCEESGFSLSKPMVSESDLNFLLTAKGRIGQAAERIIGSPRSLQSSIDNANTCLNKILMESEKTLLRQLRLGEVVTEIVKP